MTAKKISVERGMTTSVTGYGGGDDDPEEAKVNTVKTTRRRLGGGKDAAMAMGMAMGLGEELRPRSSSGRDPTHLNPHGPGDPKSTIINPK